MRAIARLSLALLGVVVVFVVVVLGALRLAATMREDPAAPSRAPESGRLVQAGSERIFIQEAGAENAPAVVFVHGTGAWSGAWRATLDLVAAEGWRAIAIDLPPFGFSPRPAEPRYSKAEQASRILGVIDALQLREAIIVGHSFGGGPATEAAMRGTGKVRGLVLVDAALSIDAEGGPAPGTARPQPFAVSALLGTAWLRDSLVAAFLTNPQFTPRLLQGFIDDPLRATPEWVEIYRRPLHQPGTTRAIGQWLPQLVAAPVVSLSESPASYRALAIPVTALWGDRDTITPLEQGRRLTSLVPNGRLVVIPGAGHIPQIEDAAAFHRALLLALKTMKKD